MYGALDALATDSQRINRSTTINQNYCGAISVCFLFALSGLFIKLMPNEITARNFLFVFEAKWTDIRMNYESDIYHFQCPTNAYTYFHIFMLHY